VNEDKPIPLFAKVFANTNLSEKPEAVLKIGAILMKANAIAKLTKTYKNL